MSSTRIPHISPLLPHPRGHLPAPVPSPALTALAPNGAESILYTWFTSSLTSLLAHKPRLSHFLSTSVWRSGRTTDQIPHMSWPRALSILLPGQQLGSRQARLDVPCSSLGSGPNTKEPASSLPHRPCPPSILAHQGPRL